MSYYDEFEEEEVVYDTTYFPLQVVRDAATGCCHDVALAIHRRMGWRIGVLLKYPVVDEFTISKDPRFVHAFAITPHGEALDMEGSKSIEQIKEAYKDPYDSGRYTQRVEVYADEEEYTHAIFKIEYIMLPREVGIEAATRQIEKSEIFLELLNSRQLQQKKRTI